MKRVLILMLISVLLTSPVMGTETKSFCAYGSGVALQIGPGGAIWDQTWGYEPFDWNDCQTSRNVDFLNGNIIGVLETATAGMPQIDPDYILRFVFGGTLTLIALDDDDPDEISGQIVSELVGTFVADLNADHAIVDEEAGTITVAFGAAVHDEPDALAAVVETSGKFRNVHQVDIWELQVNGMLTVALDLETYGNLQINILAALQNPELLLGAREELVLSGSYYRSSPKK